MTVKSYGSIIYSLGICHVCIEANRKYLRTAYDLQYKNNTCSMIDIYSKGTYCMVYFKQNAKSVTNNMKGMV